MTGVSQALLQASIDRVVARYQAQGFSVLVVAPRGADPGFDLIARRDGEERGVVLVAPRRPVHPSQLQWMESWTKSAPGRSFDIVTLGPEDLALATQSPAVLRAKLAALSGLRDAGQSDAALLLAWSVFEAAARTLLARERIEAGAGTTVIRELTRAGLISQQQAATLTAAAMQRNQVAHGVFDTIDEGLVNELALATQQILAQIDEQPTLAVASGDR